MIEAIQIPGLLQGRQRVVYLTISEPFMTVGCALSQKLLNIALEGICHRLVVLCLVVPRLSFHGDLLYSLLQLLVPVIDVLYLDILFV